MEENKEEELKKVNFISKINFKGYENMEVKLDEDKNLLIPTLFTVDKQVVPMYIKIDRNLIKKMIEDDE